jgi:hypothetical protein
MPHICLHCRDPAAINNSTLVPINCTGFSVSKPSSMLHRMLLPVISTDVVNVEEALQSIAPAKQGPAAGRNTHCLSFTAIPQDPRLTESRVTLIVANYKI